MTREYSSPEYRSLCRGPDVGLDYCLVGLDLWSIGVSFCMLLTKKYPQELFKVTTPKKQKLAIIMNNLSHDFSNEKLIDIQMLAEICTTFLAPLEKDRGDLKSVLNQLMTSLFFKL